MKDIMKRRNGHTEGMDERTDAVNITFPSVKWEDSAEYKGFYRGEKDARN